MLTTRADHGGGPAHIATLVANLPQHWDVRIACPDEEPYRARFAALVSERAVLQLRERTPLFSSMLQLRRYCSGQRIEILHSHGKRAGLLGRVGTIGLETRSVHTFHGFHVDRYSRIIRVLYIGAERLLSSVTHSVIAVSEEESDTLSGSGAVPARLVRLVPNGVGVDPTRATGSWPRSRVVFVGRLAAVKGTGMLADVIELAVRGNPERISFDIVGDGPDGAVLKERLGPLVREGVVRFHGYLDDPSSVLRGALATLNTSVSEGLPLAILEAFAQGVPAVATRVRGNRELLGAPTPQLLFETPSQAVDALTHLQDSHSWELASQSVYAAACLRYSASTMSSRTMEVYAAAASTAIASND